MTRKQSLGIIDTNVTIPSVDNMNAQLPTALIDIKNHTHPAAVSTLENVCEPRFV